MKNSRKKSLICLLLAIALLIPSFNFVYAANDSSTNDVVADWKFTRENSEGNIADASLKIKDASGNGNDLKMQVYKDRQPTSDASSVDLSKYIKFDNKGVLGNESIDFSGNNWDFKGGADFITVDNAPINKEEFRNGYTIELLYYFPEDWTANDKWMGVLTRQVKNTSNVKTMDEPELGSTSLAISNVKEFQYLTANADDSHQMQSSAWGLSMDKGGQWYHLAVVADNNGIKTFVNGGESFRNYDADKMVGIFADPEDGRFRVGSSYWLEGTQTLDKFLNGNIERIRITGKPLEKKDWLVEPETLAGDFGNNNEINKISPNGYNFVFIPDTQNTVKFKPEVIEAGIDGLLADVDKLNIKGIFHLGDVVEDYWIEDQFKVAEKVFDKIPKSGVSNLTVPGNHDYVPGQDMFYKNYFGEGSNYAKLQGDSVVFSPSGRSSYTKIKAGSYEYLVLALSWYDLYYSNDFNWAQEVLDNNKNLPTILVNHNILNNSDTEPNSVMLSKGGGLNNVGQDIWDYLIKNNSQVFMTYSGHHHGAGYTIKKNDAGQDVLMVLADYQFGYNGGNAFFKYAEFDEDNNKIYIRTYSPYAATLKPEDKGFFDVNFMNGRPGNDDEINFNFTERFDGLKQIGHLKPIILKDSESAPITKWAHGEIHNHTLGSNDASEPYLLLENTLNAAFREDLDKMPKEGDPSLNYGDAFDYLMTAEHLRKSPRNINGEDDLTPTYKYMAEQAQKWNELKESGKYRGKIYYPGFEWDMFGLDHAAVGIIGDNPNEFPIDAVREFEWLFSYDTPTELFDNDEESLFGPRSNEKSNKENTFKGLEWLEKNYPNSIMIANHPSRKNGDAKELKAEDLRRMQDTAPSVFAGIEGIPGNQMGWDRGELPKGAIQGGTDIIVSKVGGMWDALLGEGRKVYTFANSDFHFKISSNRLYSSGYWPSEYSRNITFVENAKNYSDIAKALKTGNSTMVTGDLISRLEFNALQEDRSAVMGSTLEARKGDNVTLKIKFKESDFNNYRELTPHTTDVTNTPKVDHVDIIGGEVRPNNDRTLATNDTTKVIKRFDRSEFGPKDFEGYYTLTFEVPNDKDMYYRLRGTNLAVDTVGETQDGEPIDDQNERRPEGVSAEPYFNEYNDRNYRDLWFYSNPIFVKAVNIERPITPTPEYPTPEFPSPIRPDNNRRYNPFVSGFFFGNGNISNEVKPVEPKPVESKNIEITDIAGHWAEKSVREVVNKGYMELDNGKFFPNVDATRLEYVKALAKLAKVNPKDYMNKTVFKDVKAGTTDAGYINWAYEKGIIKGTGEGDFEGDRNITRQEIATILNRYEKAMNLNLSKKDAVDFSDNDKIADWAKADVKEAHEKGIFNGKDNNMFDPLSNITRAEVAQVVVNMDR